ncbi:hypothetical protein DFA_01826 [Cavenderia fasciculata]|uniref:Uncharacterized protein n=1 Tax=Cavenderia fasciculata TaxID=261658 RepID=F4PUX8_CACFS|nr:uncharacterized protein DFA_01826 [Cavenderia fasciculata]EGG21940.1 hypothetical protein DFA_01826 [Cavenderia fasciculata]|eukprot:XP_004359791.1 hypothetical protein DFA_01826 [Cavenderia fasciculata]
MSFCCWCCIISRVISVLAILLVSSVGQAQFTTDGFPYQVFSNSSAWNQLIPSGATVEPLSASMLLLIKNSQTTNGLSFAYYQWTAPLHNVDSTTFTTRINIYQPQGEFYHNSVDPLNTGQILNLPVPSTVNPDPMADGHMIVYDRATYTFYEFSRFIWQNSTWASATRFDRFQYDVSGSYPAFNAGGSRWWMRAVRGAGSTFIGGLIRWDELVVRGELNHVLAMSGPVNRMRKTESPGYTYELCSPVSSRTDGWYVGTNTVMEGQRIRLNPSFNVNSLTGTKARIIARTLQLYGAYVVDNSVDASLYFENKGGNYATSPWASFASDIGQIQAITLDNYQVLTCDTPVTK